MTTTTTTTDKSQQKTDEDKTIQFNLHDFKNSDGSWDFSDDPLNELLYEFETGDPKDLPSHIANYSPSQMHDHLVSQDLDEELPEEFDTLVLLEDQVKLLSDSIERINYYLDEIELLS